MKRTSCKLFLFFTTLFSWAAASSFVVPEEVKEMLRIMEVENDGALPSIVEATQKAWVRPTHKERWQIEDIDESKRSAILTLSEKMGLFIERKPSDTYYDYAIILGATTLRMQDRLNFLKHLLDSGITCKEIVFLVGTRPLDRSIEEAPSFCSTEAEAARYLWDVADLPPPYRLLPVSFNITGKVIDKGIERRANTLDTVLNWLKTAPKPGKCLFISNQPYCFYQESVIEANMPEEFSIEIVGSGADPKKSKASVILDSIAQGLFWKSTK